LTLAAPIVDITATPGGNGYWLAASDGGIFAYGDAIFRGSAGSLALDRPVTAMASTGTGDGYWLASTPGNDAFGPPIPADSGSGRRIVYSNGDQRVWIIEDGESAVTTYLVSGRKNDPKNGNYKVYSKSRNAWAGHHGITMEYMIRFAFGKTLAIGFHSIPKWGDGTPVQTEEQLGTYRSSGCVRQRVGQAKFLYDWADIGTPGIVVP